MLELVKVSYDLGWYDMALDCCNYLLEIYPDNNDALQLLRKIKKHKPPAIGFIKGLITQVNGKED